MDQSNMIVQGIETHGVRTFSAKEMAFNILGLMHPILFSITQVEPVWGDPRLPRPSYCVMSRIIIIFLAFLCVRSCALSRESRPLHSCFCPLVESVAVKTFQKVLSVFSILHYFSWMMG